MLVIDKIPRVDLGVDDMIERLLRIVVGGLLASRLGTIAVSKPKKRRERQHFISTIFMPTLGPMRVSALGALTTGAAFTSLLIFAPHFPESEPNPRWHR